MSTKNASSEKNTDPQPSSEISELDHADSENPEVFTIEISSDENAIPDKIYDVISKLENELENQKDARKEERFYWIIVLIVFGNIFSYQALDSFLPWAILFIFQIAILGSLAKKLGHEQMHFIMVDFMNWVKSLLPKPK